MFFVERIIMTEEAEKPKPKIRISYLRETFPYMLSVIEKHATSNYLITEKNDLLNALRTTYNQRNNDKYADGTGIWYDDQDAVKLAKLFADATAFAAKSPERLSPDDIELYAIASFLNYRSRGEYEGIEEEAFDKPYDVTPVVSPTIERDIIHI